MPTRPAALSGGLNSLYRDEENGKWKTTRSFGRNDLLVLAKLADQVHSRIFELEAAEADNDRDA